MAASEDLPDFGSLADFLTFATAPHSPVPAAQDLRPRDLNLRPRNLDLGPRDLARHHDLAHRDDATPSSRPLPADQPLSPRGNVKLISPMATSNNLYLPQVTPTLLKLTAVNSKFPISSRGQMPRDFLQPSRVLP